MKYETAKAIGRFILKKKKLTVHIGEKKHRENMRSSLVITLSEYTTDRRHKHLICLKEAFALFQIQLFPVWECVKFIPCQVQNTLKVFI